MPTICHTKPPEGIPADVRMRARILQGELCEPSCANCALRNREWIDDIHLAPYCPFFQQDPAPEVNYFYLVVCEEWRYAY
jgi:hypothetical protein